MSIKQKLADGTVKQLFELMSSPHFMQLSNAMWRQLNDRQLAKLGATAEWDGITGRLRRLEQRGELLQAKLDALQSLIDKREEAVVDPSRSAGAAE